jgi:lysine/ornithine N-monooxygenase
MTGPLDAAIIGAGPFGLSISAHLYERRICIFGRPMQTWRERMPAEMLLRSAWEETSLSAPEAAGTIDVWSRQTGEAREEPIPLAKFLRYSDWFREQFVADVRPVDAESVEYAGGTYRVTGTDGSVEDARQLILAVGVIPFRHAPASLAEGLGEGVELAADRQDFAALADRRVVVVGGGQSGLEAAGLAAHAGADVQLVTRSSIRWFADREPHNPRSKLGQRLYRIAYPVVGYGPPPLNRIVTRPDLYAKLPFGFRSRLTRRLLRSGGSPWLRAQVEDKVVLRPGTHVDALDRSNGALRLRLSDGAEAEADVVLIAAGYRFSTKQLSFLSPELRASISTTNDWPDLDRGFRSASMPSMFLVGYPAEGRFGPISRYVLGADFTARRVREYFAW